MTALQFINEQLTENGINYEFNEWTSAIKYPYFVGEEFQEDEIQTEDGMETSTMLLTGFHRGSYLVLEETKNKIKELFNPIFGLSAKTDSGTIVVFFAGSFNIPSGEADLKKIQITLKIKEWKGAI